MVIGGLMAEAFKTFLGNPDIMASLMTWAIFLTLVLTVIEVFKETKL